MDQAANHQWRRRRQAHLPLSQGMARRRPRDDRHRRRFHGTQQRRQHVLNSGGRPQNVQGDGSDSWAGIQEIREGDLQGSQLQGHDQEAGLPDWRYGHGACDGLPKQTTVRLQGYRRFGTFNQRPGCRHDTHLQLVQGTPRYAPRFGKRPPRSDYLRAVLAQIALGKTPRRNI